MSSTHLPSPRQVITDLVHQINSRTLPPPQSQPDPDPAPPNPLKNLPQSTRQLFVTLHCLLPSSFLPALDLLDKRLVTRYTPDTTPPTATTSGDRECRETCVYYVAPTQVLSRSRFTAGPPPASYEVRTDAWSCSCAGFSFASYGPQAEAGGEGDEDGEGEGGERGVEAGTWGGLMLGSGSPPVCKHLVACYLAQQCWELFGGYVKDERVSVERLAEMAVL